MNFGDWFNNGKKLVKANSPEILTAFSISGLFATAYLTATGSFKAARAIDKTFHSGETQCDEPTLREQASVVWKFYIPAGTTAALTVVAIVGSSKAGSRRTAAAVTAYSITEKAFVEYREKVVEEIGKGKEEKIRDSLAQAKVAGSEAKEVIVISSGNILCHEALTGRFFRSEMEALRKAETQINARINNHIYVTLDEFYDIVGLPHTSMSDLNGWDSKHMHLEFSTTLYKEEPCLSFTYNYIKLL